MPPGALQAKLPLMLPPKRLVQAAICVAASPSAATLAARARPGRATCPRACRARSASSLPARVHSASPASSVRLSCDNATCPAERCQARWRSSRCSPGVSTLPLLLFPSFGKEATRFCHRAIASQRPRSRAGSRTCPRERRCTARWSADNCWGVSRIMTARPGARSRGQHVGGSLQSPRRLSAQSPGFQQSRPRGRSVRWHRARRCRRGCCRKWLRWHRRP